MRFGLKAAGVAALGGLLAMSVALFAQSGAGGDSGPAATTQQAGTSPGAGLAGLWHLNKELTTLPRSASANGEPEQPAGGGRQPGAGGGGYGGGGYGGGGGRGGRGGGRGMGGGGNNPQVMSEDLLKMRALMRALAEPADRLTILVSPAEVATTDEHGAVLKFKTDGKKQEINYGPGALIDTKARWDGDALSLELTAGSMKLVETYAVTKDNPLLVISVQPAPDKNSGGRSMMAPMKFVYGRGE